MSLRFHELAEANHRILNPFTEDKLMLLGEVCRLRSGLSQLDLCCGKGEMLSLWALRFGIAGIGVDISHVFLSAARDRADELGVGTQVKFIQGNAAAYQPPQSFNIVSCIGATWIGDGLTGTLKLMKPMLKDENSLLLVGEPYFISPPPEVAYAAWGVKSEDYTSLTGTLDRMESAGFELVEMVLADQNSWDRYEASQWFTLSDWLRANPDDPDAPELRTWLAKNRRAYLEYGRDYLGWGVFVLRQK
ncbi:MAG: class I SAM-dependent methyltransferase [Anaerolineaceae bacterium]|nr:class I SAM-dependent methyltransferase [Anaerolineaceae bacterium]